MAEQALRVIYQRPDLSDSSREQFIARFLMNKEELTICKEDLDLIIDEAQRKLQGELAAAQAQLGLAIGGDVTRQVKAGALMYLWRLLGAKNQTEAVSQIELMKKRDIL